ncbi:MAG: hypothetical protein EBT99_16025, partial [Betaproteobacteria bacterium]|nr:hypothetical protein [Betaproteobacteria bacterium]
MNISHSSTNVGCFGGQTGSITISVSGGTGSYNFSWTGPNGFSSSNQNISNLFAGTYSVIVSDANNCTEVATVVISEPSQIQATSNVTNISCFNGSNGSIDITTSGGTGGYTFAWTGPNGYTNSSEDILSLVYGTYNLTILDNANCQSNFQFFVSQPTLLTASINILNPIACNGGAAVIEVVASGGTPNYIGTGPVSGLTAGTHTYTITDGNNCTASASITLTEPDALVVSTSQT